MTKGSQKISLEKLESTVAELDRLSQKKSEELTLRQSIDYLRGKLRKALNKGYSYQELSEILRQQEIVITAGTLKQYINESNRKEASKKRSVAAVTKTKQAKSLPGEELDQETASILSEPQQIINSDSDQQVSVNNLDTQVETLPKVESQKSRSSKKQDDSVSKEKTVDNVEGTTQTQARPKTFRTRGRKTSKTSIQ
jgi:hypothetical protein